MIVANVELLCADVAADDTGIVSAAGTLPPEAAEAELDAGMLLDAEGAENGVLFGAVF